MSQQWEPYSQQGPAQSPGQRPYQGQPRYQQPYQGQVPYQGRPYPAQPNGLPPGRQHYPDPGYGNGLGPKPPWRPWNSHLGRNILAGIGAVVLAGIAVSVISSHGDGVPTAPSGSSGPACPQKAAVPRIGSCFVAQDGSGDTYNVTLVKIIDPARGADQYVTPGSGKRFVGAVFKIKALSGSPQDEDADNDAALIGSDGQTYTADFADLTGYTNFSDGSIHVTQGGITVGAVAFEVPDGVKVTEVQWSAASGTGAMVQWDVGSQHG